MTTAPGPDCEPYHNRQPVSPSARRPVVLEPDQWATWLDPGANPAPCLRAGLEGVIAVDRATEPPPPVTIAPLEFQS